MKQRIIITKLDAARRQLNTAILLFFTNGDFVSIHSLANAAFTLTKNLCDKTNHPASFTKWVRDTVHPSQHQQLFAALSVAGNFAKHADRDPDKQLEYIPDQYTILLILAVQMYEAITSELSMPMAVYKSWYFIQNPTWCADPHLRVVIPVCKKHIPSNKVEFYDLVSKALRISQRRLFGQSNS